MRIFGWEPGVGLIRVASRNAVYPPAIHRVEPGPCGLAKNLSPAKSIGFRPPQKRPSHPLPPSNPPEHPIQKPTPLLYPPPPLRSLASILLALILAACSTPQPPPANPSPPTGTIAYGGPPPNASAQNQTSISTPRSPTKSPKSIWNLIFFWRKPRPPAALPLTPVGRIFLINTPANFALIETPRAALIPTGTLLHTLNEGQITATLRVSGQRRPPLMVAELERGLPRPGEPVYQLDTTTAPAFFTQASPSSPPSQTTAQIPTPSSPPPNQEDLRAIILQGMQAARERIHQQPSQPHQPENLPPHSQHHPTDHEEFPIEPIPDLPLIPQPR